MRHTRRNGRENTVGKRSIIYFSFKYIFIELISFRLFSGIASALVLIVILGIGFLFRTLPICCLASIIVVALLHMLMEVKIVVAIYKRSKFEAVNKMISCLNFFLISRFENLSKIKH